MKKILTTTLALLFACAPIAAKEKKQEKEKTIKTVKTIADLRPNKTYLIETGGVRWTISDDTTKVISIEDTQQKKDKKSESNAKSNII